MASSRNSKTSGLRFLWIPGRRKHDRKGHLESTSKHVSYNTPQKKNQLWSLGGSKAQKDLLESKPDTSLFDGPSVSGLTPLVACSVTAAATTPKFRTNHMETNMPSSDAPPTTPNSSSSTALLVSIPNSPEPTVTVTSSGSEANDMPSAKYSSPSTTTTTVAEIIEPNNRYSRLNRDGNEELDPYSLPTPPKSDTNWRDSHRLNASGDANSSIATIASSPSPNSEAKSSSEHSASSSPTKKKSPRSHGHGDVNSIESVSDTDQIPKLDLDWIDDMVNERNANELLRKTKHKKKKQHSTGKELVDQLDGVPSKGVATKAKAAELQERVVEDDEKLVKCLYFTLMCCECSIS